MPLSRKAIATLALATILLLPLAAGASTARADDAPPPIRLQSGVLELDPSGAATLGAHDPDERLSLYIRLRGPSLGDMLDAREQRTASGAADATEPMDVASIEMLHYGIIDRQAPMIEAVEAAGARLVGTFQTSFNGLHVHASRAQLLEILRQPGVEAVSIAPTMTIDMDDARAHLGGDLVESELGWTGEGVTIAIMDTGIDYTHGAMGGAGDPADYQAAVADPTNGNDMFPNDKVTGGWDFVGENYCNTGNCEATPPEPDENPIPTHMHGTHVAGIAAGNSLPELPPGMAPGADLVALKVFSNGATDVTAEAIEWCINHNLYLDEPDSELVPGARPETKIDVLNMSLGSPWGGSNAEYQDVIARAIDAGITVVASAGNEGQTPYITGTPAAGSPLALSVASGWPPGEQALAVYAEWEDGGPQSMEEDATTDTGWLPSLEDTGLIGAPVAWYGLACSDAQGNPTDPEQDVSEKIALVERGTCPFVDKVANAESFGAVAVLMFTDDRPKTAMGGDCTDCPGIPAVMIDREPGLELRDLVQDGTEVNAILDPDRITDLDWLTDTISNFSSRGPYRYSAGIKPQITGPGSSILAANMGTGDQGTKISGTSMSGPAIAGVTALLWSRNMAEGLELGADDISALAMNYAHPLITEGRNDTGPLVGVARQGAGLANAYRSAVGGTLVRSDEGLAELSFGNVHVTEDLEVQRSLTIRNLSEVEKTYEVDYRFAFPDQDAGQGVDIDIAQPVVTVAAGESETVELTLLVTVDDLREWDLFGYNSISSYNTDPARVADALVQALEVDGYVEINEIDDDGGVVEDGDQISVPFYVLPRASACLTSDLDEGFELADADAEIEVRYENECGNVARLTATHLLGEDPLESGANDDMPAKLDGGALGVRYGTVQNADGTTTDLMEFTIAMADGHRVPADTDILVYFDTDMDGEPDRVANFLPLNGLDPTFPIDVWFSLHWQVQEGTREPGTLLTAGTVYPVNWDIDESTTSFAIPLAAAGDDLAFEDGDVSFGVSVAIRDGAEDYEMTDDYLGEDVMPDDLDDGGYYVFDQALLDCVELRVPVQNPDGSTAEIDLMDITGGFPGLSGGANVPTTLGVGCSDIGEGGEVGVLSRYIYNQPGTSAWEVRTGTLGEAAPQGGTIYLPHTSNNYEFPGEEPGEPTLEPSEPTEEPPVEPTVEPTATPAF